MMQIMSLIVIGGFLFAIWQLIRHFDDGDGSNEIGILDTVQGGHNVVAAVLRTIFGFVIFIITLVVVIAVVSKFFQGQ